MIVLAQVYKWSAEDRWATAPAFIPWCTVSPPFLILHESQLLELIQQYVSSCKLLRLTTEKIQHARIGRPKS